MLPRESAKTVRKMKSLVLFLFLGATVALAAIHVENDPYRKHHNHPMLVSFNSLVYFVLSPTCCSNRLTENFTLNNLISQIVFSGLN